MSNPLNSTADLKAVGPIQAYLEDLHARYAQDHGGEVATYIPELAKADPGWFSICIATCDGHVYQVGDANIPFTIQSMSKPLVYGLALEDRGREEVLKRISVEPTGDAFNSISLEAGTGRPLNPMINAGAIASASLVRGYSEEDKLHRVLSMMSAYAGEPLKIDSVTYQSEKETGHRNRAIGHMLRNFDILTDTPDPVLDLYFQQCSVLVNCRQLAMVAATLANGGVNPLTQERALRPEFVGDVLSVMTTCGMYDYAGEWVYRVGLPAKSGVAGGVMAVLPGQLGIGVFSPRLDARGNSVRGVGVCTQLSRDLGLHFLQPPRTGQSVIQARHTLATRRSYKRRTRSESDLLDRYGSSVRILALQGELMFSTVEPVMRDLEALVSEVDYVVLDLRKVTHIDRVAEGQLLACARWVHDNGAQLIFSEVHGHARFRRRVDEASAEAGWLRHCLKAGLDEALEWCETQLIHKHTGRIETLDLERLSQHQLCEGMSEAEVDQLRGLMREERYATGEMIIQRGAVADRLFLLISGEVSIYIEQRAGRRRRLATILPGVAFGEAAFVFGGVRSADVIADRPVVCFSLTLAAFEQMSETFAHLKITLLQNLLRAAALTSQRMVNEIAMSDG